MAEVAESRLFETVRLIREWIEGSFEPAQEERFNRAGKLKARFDVDLGSEMCEQLKVYAKASFALSKLQFNLTEREIPGKKPKPCVEVLLSAAARQLYADKHPEAVAKRRVLPALPGGDEPAKATAADAKALEEGKRGTKPSERGKQKALPGKAQPALTSGTELARRPQPTPARSSKADATAAPRSPKRLLDKPASDAQPPAKKGPAVVHPSSVWESVPAKEVPDGVQALHVAKEALDAGLQGGTGILALKAEKEAVSWLKGLSNRAVSPEELRETLIGQAVNAWRKHKEPYISSLALTLLKGWKAAWREAEAPVRRR